MCVLTNITVSGKVTLVAVKGTLCILWILRIGK